MPVTYPFEAIKLGNATQSGHVVYRKAIYDNKRIVLKLNKSKNTELSRFEVAFTGLAQRFLRPGLTSPQALVSNKDGNIVGLASEHLFYEVAATEGIEKPYYKLTKQGRDVQCDLKQVDTAEDIPVNFFDQFSPGFFAGLCDSEKKGEISFDMDSLASVLAASYTLEEDDLHKGNLGFYVVQKDGKPHVVFLKIDHDLMMSDSIMSYVNARFVNLRHGEHAFEVTARDLRDFPKLYDSNNHYWPTTRRYFTSPSDSKVYSGSDELEAFIKIGQRAEFKQAKWRHFYKHILMPTALIAESLTASFDKTNPADCAQIDMITHAVVARQARLRAVLFSMPEFRLFVKKMTAAEHQVLINEIFHNVDETIRESQEGQVRQTVLTQKQLCRNEVFARGDTPLHIAIRLGDYRYHETWKSFGQFAEVANSRGQRPLDIALEMTRSPDASNANNDVRSNPLLIAKHLLTEGVYETRNYKKISRADKLKIATCESYFLQKDWATKVSSAAELIDIIKGIGEDHRHTLKMKKSISLNVIKAFIEVSQGKPALGQILSEFKLALNGSGGIPPAPELQFIRQLRTRLWIVRQIRGLLGGTATQVGINNLLDTELKHFTPTTPLSIHSFFSTGKASKSQSNMNDSKAGADDIKPDVDSLVP